MTKHILVVFDNRSVVPNSALLFDSLDEAKDYAMKELKPEHSKELWGFEQWESENEGQDGPIVFGPLVRGDMLEYLAAIYEVKQ